ncbi:MAG TPA: SDR family oxidoreductase [Candidatus Nanopelagicales bacterium]
MSRPVAVVTGAAGGLGRVLVERLDRAGYDVVGVDLQGTDRVLDVTDPAACRALATELRPAVWVNNAGVLGAGDAATQPDELVERVVRVNLLGVIHGTRAAVASMREHGGGHVVSIASLASWVPVPGEAVYAATKAGVLSFTLGLQAELAASGVSDVRLSAVCPDGMLTPMLTDVLDDDAVALSFSAPRVAEPAQVADRVVAVLRRPRLVSSVPRWRGAQVRLMSCAPDLMLRSAPIFTRMGLRNLARVRAQASARSASGSTTSGSATSSDGALGTAAASSLPSA